MPETLTIIVSILVPTIGIQAAMLFFVFRRMDRMEERLTQRMDRADEDRAAIRAEIREESQSIRAEIREESQSIRAEFRAESQSIRAEFTEDMQDVRADLTALQTSIARLEGAVEILRGLAERIATVPR